MPLRSTRPLPATVVILGLLSLACGQNKNPKYSEEIVGREEYRPDNPAEEGGGQSGSKSGPAATATEGEPEVVAVPDCDGSYDPPVKGGVTGQLQCGGRVFASTEGGTSSFGDDFYQRAFCTPARKHYDDAPEAIYRLEVPPNTQATVRLDSPCADLDLAAVAWTLDGLPTVDQSTRVRECDMATGPAGGKLELTAVDKPQVFLVVVDGKEGDAGPFSLEVECGTYR